MMLLEKPLLKHCEHSDPDKSTCRKWWKQEQSLRGLCSRDRARTDGLVHCTIPQPCASDPANCTLSFQYGALRQDDQGRVKLHAWAHAKVLVECTIPAFINSYCKMVVHRLIPR